MSDLAMVLGLAVLDVNIWEFIGRSERKRVVWFSVFRNGGQLHFQQGLQERYTNNHSLAQGFLVPFSRSKID